MKSPAWHWHDQLTAQGLTPDDIEPATGPAMTWISVNDALPRQRGRYLIWTPHGWPDFAWWQPGGRYCTEGCWRDGPGMAAFSYQFGVTHWKLAPEGPESKEPPPGAPAKS